jgi:long-chain acyl-CoA synthetase
MAIDQFLRNSAAAYPDKTAVYFDYQEISYRTLDQEADNLAQGLLDLGLGYQGRVGIILGNNVDFVRSYFAVARAGGIIVPINPLLKSEEIKYILNDAETGYIITTSALLPLINTIRAELPCLKKIIIVGFAIEDDVNIVSFEELLSIEAKPVNIPIKEEDIAACLYTSGTTGKPKGALLSHGNLMFNTIASADRVGITPEDHSLCILPLFHSFAQMASVLIPIYNGCSITILPQFMPAKVLKEIALRRITVLCAVPAMYTALLYTFRQAEEFDLSTLRLCISGGSALPLEISKIYQQYGIILVEGNGPTETSPISYVNPPEACKVGSVGPPLTGVKVKIVDDCDQELPFGEIGEICVQGPNVMQGYLKQLEATARC